MYTHVNERDVKLDRAMMFCLRVSAFRRCPLIEVSLHVRMNVYYYNILLVH